MEANYLCVCCSGPGREAQNGGSGFRVGPDRDEAGPEAGIRRQEGLAPYAVAIPLESIQTFEAGQRRALPPRCLQATCRGRNPLPRTALFLHAQYEPQSEIRAPQQAAHETGRSPISRAYRRGPTREEPNPGQGLILSPVLSIVFCEKLYPAAVVEQSILNPVSRAWVLIYAPRRGLL